VGFRMKDNLLFFVCGMSKSLLDSSNKQSYDGGCVLDTYVIFSTPLNAKTHPMMCDGLYC
jgi:hypothetical protein